MGRLKGVVLPMEGFEALRLVDAQGLSQEEAAGRMEVSRPTICRILGEARAVVAKALANGWAIRIEADAGGGSGDAGHGHRTRRRRGRGCVDDESLLHKEDL